MSSKPSTSSPRASSTSLSLAPMKPAAPVTSTRIWLQASVDAGAWQGALDVEQDRSGRSEASDPIRTHGDEFAMRHGEHHRVVLAGRGLGDQVHAVFRTRMFDVHDPWVNVEHARPEYGVDLIAEPATGQYDAVVLAVAHGEFVAMGADRIRSLGTPGAVLFDVKRALPRASVDGCL